MTDVKLLLLHSNTWNHLTVCKKLAQARLKLSSTNHLQIIYLIYMHIQYLALNNLHWLISHKTKPKKFQSISYCAISLVYKLILLTSSQMMLSVVNSILKLDTPLLWFCVRLG